jgi:hypothetical protein
MKNFPFDRFTQPEGSITLSFKTLAMKKLLILKKAVKNFLSNHMLKK